MSETVNVEDLSPVMREFVEGLLADKEDCLFTRNGEVCGGFRYLGPDKNISIEMTPEEEEELLEVVRQGKADIAAGKGVPFAEVERLYMEKMRESEKQRKELFPEK